MNTKLIIVTNTNNNLVSVEIEHFDNILAPGGKIIYQSGKAQSFPLYKTPVIAWGVTSSLYKGKHGASALPVLSDGSLMIEEQDFIIQDVVTGSWYGQVYFEQSSGKNDADLCGFLAEMAREKYLDIKSKAA
jgi:hypothetical protein